MSPGWFYLCLAVACSTAIWPVARRGLRDGAPAVVGFWTSLAMAIFAAVGAAVRGDPAPPAGVWIAGGILAVAYALGFWVLVMHCLKTGPAGPTVTVNNMAMVCGVLYGALYLRPQGIPNVLVIAGAAGTCVALVLIGMGNRGRSTAPGPATYSDDWLPMLLAGGAFSGLSFMTQTYVGQAQPAHGFAYLAIGGGGSALLLFPTVLADPRPFDRIAIACGTSVGVASGLGMTLTLAAFQHLSPAVVLPFSVTTPVLLMLVIGHFAYREHLTRAQLAGSLAGAGSVLLLALGSAPAGPR